MVLYDGHVESTTPRFGQVADCAHQESCGQVYWNHARFQVDRIRTGIYLVPGSNDSTFVISRARKNYSHNEQNAIQCKRTEKCQ